MDYLAKFLAIQAQPKPVLDPLSEFHKSWNIIKVRIFVYPPCKLVDILRMI